ncbi:MAG: nucleotidyltransferase, partial [Clostridia bacterium]|nr:nucleotidyltransferase [Clostridia bacterium]
NFWGLTPAFIDGLEEDFTKFLSTVKEGDIKCEYLLPSIIDDLIKAKKATVKVLETKDKWFGVTYKEDAPVVIESIKKLIADGLYPEKLM